jgi:hypothetical protein
MHTIKLQVQDTIYDHIIFLLKNLNTKELKIIEDHKVDRLDATEKFSEINAFSNHSATLIDEWKDTSEDDIWK